MNCPECGRPLITKTKQMYEYRECGLEGIGLSGIRTFTCVGCKMVFPEIPNVIRLHEVIAGRLMEKPSPLTGPEFRFLRKLESISSYPSPAERYNGFSHCKLTRNSRRKTAGVGSAPASVGRPPGSGSARTSWSFSRSSSRGP